MSYFWTNLHLRTPIASRLSGRLVPFRQQHPSSFGVTLSRNAISPKPRQRSSQGGLTFTQCPTRPSSRRQPRTRSISIRRLCPMWKHGMVPSLKSMKLKELVSGGWLSDTRWAPHLVTSGKCQLNRLGRLSIFFSALSNLYHFYSLYSTGKYVG